MKKNSAFTLIEILIVVSIFSLLIISVYSVFRTGLASNEKIEKAGRFFQGVRLSMNLMETDLKNAFNYSKADSNFIGSNNSVQFSAVCDEYEKSGAIYSDIKHIGYELSDDSLIRKSKSSIGIPKEEEIWVCLSGIKELSVQFAAPAGDSTKMYKWQDSWPLEGEVSQKKELPIAVRVKLILEDDSGNLAEFDKTIPIYAQ